MGGWTKQGKKNIYLFDLGEVIQWEMLAKERHYKTLVTQGLNGSKPCKIYDNAREGAGGDRR